MILQFIYKADVRVICECNYGLLVDFKALRDWLKMFVFICGNGVKMSVLLSLKEK